MRLSCYFLEKCRVASIFLQFLLLTGSLWPDVIILIRSLIQKYLLRMLLTITFLGSNSCHTAGSGSRDKLLLSYKILPRHAQIYSLWQPSPTPGLLVWLVTKPGRPVSTDRRGLIRRVTGALKPVAPGRWFSSVRQDRPSRRRILWLQNTAVSQYTPPGWDVWSQAQACCVCMYVCVCVFMYIYIYVCIHVWVYDYSYIYIYVCVCARAPVRRNSLAGVWGRI